MSCRDAVDVKSSGSGRTIMDYDYIVVGAGSAGCVLAPA